MYVCIYDCALLCAHRQGSNWLVGSSPAYGHCLGTRITSEIASAFPMLLAMRLAACAPATLAISHGSTSGPLLVGQRWFILLMLGRHLAGIVVCSSQQLESPTLVYIQTGCMQKTWARTRCLKHIVFRICL